MSVFSPTQTYQAMSGIRHLIETLLGGTQAMRIAGKTYLPQEAAERDADYMNRLHRSVLFNQLDRTIQACVGKILSKPLSFQGTTPEIDRWIENIDLDNTHLDRFVRQWAHDGIANGVSYCLVDAPPSDKPRSERTLKDDIDEGNRPYLSFIPAKSVIGWRFLPTRGAPTLSQVRILQEIKVPDGPFGEKIEQRVLVLEIGLWSVYSLQENPDKTSDQKTIDVLEQVGETGLDYIPLVPFYTNKIAQFEALPPLAALAELNLRHWQSYSDQCNILKVARIPILARTGTMNNDDHEPMVLSSGSSIELGTGEDIKWVEHNGNAITAGRQDLLDIQDQMEKCGFSLTARETSGDVTATENSLSAAESHAALQMFALNLQDAIETCLKIMCDMANIDAEPSVIVNKEFGASLNASDMPLLLQMREKGDIRQETVLQEAKRRGLLSEDTDIAAEVKAKNEAAEKVAGVFDLTKPEPEDEIQE